MTDPGPPLLLTGLSVLIIRPRRQAEGLALVIAAAGGQPVVLPTIEIQPFVNDQAVRAVVSKVMDCHIAVFVSANAVEQCMPYLFSADKPFRQSTFAAIGEATKRALEVFGVNNVLT